MEDVCITVKAQELMNLCTEGGKGEAGKWRECEEDCDPE
jgi:hypothetical protein